MPPGCPRVLRDQKEASSLARAETACAISSNTGRSSPASTPSARIKVSISGSVSMSSSVGSSWHHRIFVLLCFTRSGRSRRGAAIALRVQLGGGGCDSLLGRVRAVRGAFDLEHFDIGHADETEYALEIRHLEVERRIGGVDVAARRDEDHLLARDETFRPFFAVAEGAAGARHIIDPGFQVRRDG